MAIQGCPRRGLRCTPARERYGHARPREPYPDRQAMLADAAAQIRMPGADELRPVGAERRTTQEGYATAFVGVQ